jgi:hypothetical protein
VLHSALLAIHIEEIPEACATQADPVFKGPLNAVAQPPEFGRPE